MPGSCGFVAHAQLAGHSRGSRCARQPEPTGAKRRAFRVAEAARARRVSPQARAREDQAGEQDQQESVLLDEGRTHSQKRGSRAKTRGQSAWPRESVWAPAPARRAVGLAATRQETAPTNSALVPLPDQPLPARAPQQRAFPGDPIMLRLQESTPRCSPPFEASGGSVLDARPLGTVRTLYPDENPVSRGARHTHSLANPVPGTGVFSAGSCEDLRERKTLPRQTTHRP